jgi:SAM-dependent methyltransferase
MVAGRRSIDAHDDASWVFNRMANVYDARPPYPRALIEAVAERATARGGRTGDLGAGIGHLALPLAERGLNVVAVEPAARMLERLRREAMARKLSVQVVRAPAEATSLEAGSLDLAVVADAMHFIDAELAAIELLRVLAPWAGLAIITCELGDTPFMRAVGEIIEDSTPRRPRNMSQAITQVFRATGIRPRPACRYHDETPVDEATLERILRSISFIGPAMNADRFAVFRNRIRAVPGPRVWARTLTLHEGHRPLVGASYSGDVGHGPERCARLT